MQLSRFFSKFNLAAAIILSFLMMLMIIYISASNHFRADWSGRNLYSLSDKTIKLLEQLDRKVNVVVIIQNEHPLKNKIENLLEEYLYHSKALKVQWVDPHRDTALTKQFAVKYNLTQAPSIIFDINGKYRVLDQDDLASYATKDEQGQSELSAFKGEQAFSSAIQGLLQEKKPIVYFLVGHGEHRFTDFDQIKGYSRVGKIMQQDNITLKELLLTDTSKIPNDASALVIAGPMKRMSNFEVDLIDDYLSRSGRVMMLLDAIVDTGLEPMLRRWRVALRDDFVLDPDNMLQGSFLIIREYTDHPINAPMKEANARFHLPRSIEPIVTGEKGDDHATVVPLLKTSKNSWSETQIDQLTARYDENSADLRGSFSLGVAIERGASRKELDVQIKPSRMVVFGDSDFVSNTALTGGDQDLYMSAINWLLTREQLIAVAAKPIDEIKLTLTTPQLKKQAWLHMCGIPLISVIAGLFIWWFRRK